MSQQEKSAYYQALKKAGVEFDHHYRTYSVADLQAAYDKLRQGMPDLPERPDIAPRPVPSFEDQAEQTRQVRKEQHEQAAQALKDNPSIRHGEADPNEMPGMRLNTKDADEPIRVDDQGRIWYQEEVLKPGYAKARGRRVLQYTDRGTVTKTVQNGDYLESFEVAGDGPAQAGEIKITMPSYQTGIYRDKRYPFKIHTYNGNQGFDFAEVAKYYGGVDLVPATVKRIYVENVLCYDMRSTIQTIQAEYRQLQLAGRIR